MHNDMVQSLIILFIALAIAAFKRWRFEVERKRRREYYRNVYLKSDEWKRKRHVVLKRDNWRCTCCGEPATQVHHKRYAKRNIGNHMLGDATPSLVQSSAESKERMDRR